MLICSFLSGAAALLCWPPETARRRLTVLASPAIAVRRRSRSSPQRLALLGVLAVGLVVTLTLGVAAGVALVLLAAAACWHWRARGQAREQTAAASALAEAVRTMVAELRSGAHPAAAAEVAAMDADPQTAGVLRTIGAAARLGGDLDAALLTQAAPGPGRDVLAQLARAWSLARDHGLPLAGVLEAVHRDIEAQVRLANQVSARMAGPRASAGILAVLPIGGIALGQAMGADPLRVLVTTLPGQVLVVIGAGLILAGVSWSAALTGRVLVR
ncbi:type II secretion system F family protein [Saccharomonospora sp. NPDC046836]|uniref:type II secretion system F family protein n=1 Tax=Saccharomonospora sp. NPDC046836 TaxID=3156921 RepID=UPI0033D01469